jgi:hypothetical protein
MAVGKFEGWAGMKIDSIQCLGRASSNAFVFETPQRSAAVLARVGAGNGWESLP